MASLIDNTIHLQELRKAAEEMENRDRLTGLFHIRHARILGEGYVNAAIRDRVPFSMALLYLSNFKEYNEVNGYQRGDFLLQKTAELLKDQEVTGVVPARCYGATFLVLYPGKNEDQGRYLVDQFHKGFDKFSFYGEKQLAASRIVPKFTLAEYRRDQGQSFDEFFAAIEGL
jgi:diguanylate cyclase (GGDEF)-like protein